MAWAFEEISKEELMKLIKGFVDILILASGYQSSGLPALWDSLNIKMAFQWALFFENVCNRLSGSDDYQDSIYELDSALSRMTSKPSFPQGLAHLSFATLKNARGLVLEHLVHTLPLKDTHLRSFLGAAAEMELEELSKSGCSCLSLHANKLAQRSTSMNFIVDRKNISTSPGTDSTIEIENCADGCLKKCITQELVKRQSAVSCISSAETGLNFISNVIRCTSQDIKSQLFKGKGIQEKAHGLRSCSKDQWIEFVAWSNWKSRSISYFLDCRTLRLVSGASMIFSVPRNEWMQVLKQLVMSANGDDAVLSEAVELLLLGCVANQWTSIIEHITKLSFDITTISKQLYAVFNLPSEASPSFHCRKEIVDSKEFGILEYLTELLDSQVHHLWKLSPALVAVAIPSWSTLFKLYLTEVEGQFKGAYSMLRCCSCPQEEREHKNCELAERIWCLYMFHVLGFSSS